MSVELSIIIPCLDEAQTLASCIRKAQGFLDRYGVSGEIVIGDNGSPVPTCPDLIGRAAFLRGSQETSLFGLFLGGTAKPEKL